MVEDIPVAGTPLDPGLFSGKRRAPRKRRALSVECTTAAGDVVLARTVDVSRGGMLLEMLDETLRTPADASHLVEFATRMMTLFPDGISASFGSGAVHARAEIVRLVSDRLGATTILVGCRFESPLETVDCRLLGLDFEGDETVERAAAAARAERDAVPAGEDALAFLTDVGNPWSGTFADVAGGGVAVAEPEVETSTAVATEAAPPSVVVPLDDLPIPSIDDDAMRRLLRRPAAEVGFAPRAPLASWAPVGDVVAQVFRTTAQGEVPIEGRLVEVKTRALVVELGAADACLGVGSAEAVLGARARVVCLRDGRVLWDVSARVQHVADARGAVAATLVADVAASPSVRRTFGLLALDAA